MPYVDDIPFAGGDTSADAAKAIKPDVLTIRRKVFRALVDGATCDEIEQTLELTHQTASARVRELAQAGTIRDSGERRLTRSGRKAIVWIAV